MKKLRDISVRFMKGVGPSKAKLFLNLGIETIEDMLNFFPKRYEDRRALTPIAQVNVGQPQTVTGKVLRKASRKSWHTKKHVLEVILDDQTGRISCTWFNQPYLENYFQKGKTVICYGKVDEYRNNLQMISPEYEIIDDEDESLSIKRIVPIYPLTRGVGQRFLRKIINNCLEVHKDQLSDELPVSLRNKHRLSNIKRSISNMHFPETFEDQESALKRISFEEFYFYQISIILRKFNLKRKEGFVHMSTDAQVLKFILGFPFELTLAQKKVIREIRKDMKDSSPMLRFLQGDVGSGKTIVAIFGCYLAFLNKKQSAIMAPTEILARQHYQNIKNMAESGPLQGATIALMVSGIAKKEKERIGKDIAAGEIDIVVGTHALISEGITFKNLSFAVIDEQHKFGVQQRALLTEKSIHPDVLMMTATPIPRTLYISLCGDMDISVIDELPSGRGRIKTLLYSMNQYKSVHDLVRKKVAEGRQAYFVYPIIEESEKLDLKAAEAMYRSFKKNEYKDFNVGIIHGQLGRDEVKDIMDQFKNKKIDILVATTVIEVGIDVANATVMVIEHAERFGLAQLHQLRGRIGRGSLDSLCLLVADPKTGEGHQRLDAIVSTTDGFKIAERDLMIRGPGHFFGRHQHGFSELRVANPVTQLDILTLARREAVALAEDDPKLEKDYNGYIRDVIEKRYPQYLSMVQAG